ncbi:MAG: cyclic pyranopterin monophosphate synthase MoaC [Melioribacteraceae bacterium]|nr:cyclic pyranopterin monophosphate synthase MoaC [Melioribacteraceae bacterium]
MKKFSHVDENGKANMVDISEKKIQIREAFAEGFISLSNNTIKLIKENKLKKGDVLTIAEIAGIQGGKKTSELIPLCHPIEIKKIDVKTSLKKNGVSVTSYAKCIGQTGIEMEVLTATSIALLTIYDMCKAVDKEMKISDIKLIEKKKLDL